MNMLLKSFWRDLFEIFDIIQIVAAERRVSRCLDDPDLFLVSDEEDLVNGFSEFEPTTGVTFDDHFMANVPKS
jgi:hypothetical protein